MYAIQNRLALLCQRLARENTMLLSLLRDGYSLAQAEEVLSSQAEGCRKRTPLAVAIPRESRAKRPLRHPSRGKIHDKANASSPREKRLLHPSMSLENHDGADAPSLRGVGDKGS